MTNNIHLPQYKRFFYQFEPETGKYIKTEKNALETPLIRLPYKLIVEPSIVHQIKCNAAQVIRGEEKYKSGSWKFFTGLQTTDFKEWFSGNHYEILKTGKVLSLCLFHFTTDRTRLTVYYCSRFYKESRAERDLIITLLIQKIQKEL